MTTRIAYRTCPLCEATCGLAITVEDEQVKVIRTPNQMEAVMAHMQKRKPDFAD